MQTEIEAKFLRVDTEQLRARLKSLKAIQNYPERPMRRRSFDYADWRLEKIGGRVRVRDEGDKVTMSYKQLSDRTLHGTKEVNLIINDFEQGTQFLLNIGLVQKAYQETKRELWGLDGVEITIDTWP